MLTQGCCGWGYFKVNDFLREYKGLNEEGADWKEIYDHKIQAYADFFDLVEVNKTFYQLPQVKTARKWRKLAFEVNDDFEFIVKAPKVITHQDRFAGEESVGKFDEVKRIAEGLDSQFILLQTPPSFGPDKENIENMDKFFSEIDGEDFLLAWEPRGEWEDSPEKIRKVCEKHELVHCTDPFRLAPAVETPISYLRLHGKPPGEEMYKYTFEEEDLRKLRKLIGGIETDRLYLLWNNYNMYRDLKKFESLLKD